MFCNSNNKYKIKKSLELKDKIQLKIEIVNKYIYSKIKIFLLNK